VPAFSPFNGGNGPIRDGRPDPSRSTHVTTSTSRTHSSERRWTTLDTLFVTAITALAGALRYQGITTPNDFVFDEFYASDACFYLRGPHAHCLTDAEISMVHPPLAKWLMALGVRAFGFTPAGWRVAPLIAGTLSIAVLYLLARRLLGSTLGASLAAGILTFDLLHFVMSRTAMLDIFVVFFGLLSFLCLLYDRDGEEARAPASRTLLLERLRERRWLFGAGLAAGAAMASKWSGAYLLAAVAVLAFLHGAARRGGVHRYRRTVREEGGLLLVALVLVPALVYTASYVGVLDGRLLARPWQNGSWAQAFLARQRLMLAHHTGQLYNHPYASPAWSWLLLKRPVLFYFHEPRSGGYQEILALGNPLVWWAGLVALAAAAWRLLQLRSVRAPETIILAGFAAGYIPWLLIVRQEAFLYYVLPAIPFVCLALGQAVVSMSARGTRAIAVGALAVASIGMFVFFRPILVGGTLSYREWERRIPFKECGLSASDLPKKPITKVDSPLKGWCWL
jgi:dolichyl-phosphate-mannose-protein mannosyltransferase